jgi:tetratricopeptide (TPR) repeat protein
MKKALRIISVLAILPFAIAAQPAYQSAYRAFNDYTTTLQDKAPDLTYLMKAKEKIDVVLASEDKDKPKIQALNCKINYAMFQSNLDAEKKKLGSTVSNASELAEMAYGNVSMKELELAGEALEKVVKAEAAQAEKPYLQELGMVALAMLGDVQNLAIGRFKLKKYDEAMELFSDSYIAYKQVMAKKDSGLIFNALLSAEFAKKAPKVLEYGKVMLDDKVANAYVYNKMHFANLELKDTVKAEANLKEGLALFPNDKNLIISYINLCLQTKKETEALQYIEKAIEKEPKNSMLYLVKGQSYAAKANPKSPKTGRDTLTPPNFLELIQKAEGPFLKAVESNPNGFDENLSLGAVYNNWGNWYSKQAENADAKSRPDQETKSKECWKKAVTYLEKAHTIKPCEKPLMRDLARLYRFTEQMDKATEMQAKSKAPCNQ